MQLSGFSISKDCVALEQGSDYFDLHNNFDFQEVVYSPKQRRLELCWSRGQGEWVTPTEPIELRIVFSDVYLFKVHERDPAVPFTEDECLDIVGFIWDDLPSEMHGYTSNEPAEGCTHLNILFMSGLSIKVGAESAALHTLFDPTCGETRCG